MPKCEIYAASDYAGMRTDLMEFYYGYEKTIGEGDNEEWAFEAKIQDKVVRRYATSELKEIVKRCGDNPSDFLLAGIAKFFSENGKLE